MYPFKQRKINGTLIREFSKDVSSSELAWHRDHSDRTVNVVEGIDWLLQMDNKVPVLMEAGMQYYIPKNTYHRVIKGSTKLVLEINETASALHEYIRETLYEFIGQPIGSVDGDDIRPTPTEREFTAGQDILAGYIVVSDSHDNTPVGYAPITRTDGPDRPFLVRTTDTKWLIPFGLVRALYPQVEDTFNWVDSKEDWRDLGVGSRGTVGNFSWEWAKDEPTA